MSDSINRINAANEMRQLSVLASSQSGEAGIKLTMERLSQEIGTVSMEKPVRDEEGFNLLKNM